MARGEKREQGRKEGRKGGRRDEKTGERILRESQERKGVEERERESGEKGDRNFSSCRKNVRALCARIGATSFFFPSLSLSLEREPRFHASRRLGEGENSVFSSPRFSPS